jgi:hypothetical protein
MKKFIKPIVLVLLVAFIAIGPLSFHFANAFTIPGATPQPELNPCKQGINFIPNAICDVAADLLYLPVIIAGWILWVAGVFLNFVLTYTIIDLTSHINSITGINIAWGAIRDLMNMTFIFVLIYVAITTILGISGPQWKKTLIGVVIAAVLINFSLFFTKVIIDTSNIVALTFYNQITQCDSAISATGVTASGAGLSVSRGLANCFMKPLGLTGLFHLDAGSKLLGKLGFGKLALLSLGSTVFLVTTAFTFFAVSIMFAIRFVTFIFLMILSPIAVMGSVIPKIGDKTKEWWKKLFDQCLFAPIYMIMVWIVLKIINTGLSGIDPTTGAPIPGKELSGLFDGVDASSMIFNFVIIIIFIISTLIIAKQVANQAGSVGQKLVGAALGAGAGVAGWGGRKVIGGYGRGMADNERTKEMAANTEGRYSRLQQMRAQTSLKMGQKLAGASFDVRSSKALGAVGGAVGFDMAKEFGAGKAGGKGGYDAVVKKRVEAHDKFAKSLEPTDVDKDEAKQKLAQAKAVVPNAEEELAKYDERIAEQKGLMDRETDPRRKVEHAEGVKKLEQEKKDKSLALVNLRRTSEVEVKKAQDGVDKLMGVNKGEAKKRQERAGKEREEALAEGDIFKEEEKIEGEIKEKRDDILNELNPQIRSAKEKELHSLEKDLQAIKVGANVRREKIEKDYQSRMESAKEVASTADRRKGAYAQTISSPGWVGVNQVPFIKQDREPVTIAGVKIPFLKKGGRPVISYANKVAAAKIRGGIGKTDSGSGDKKRKDTVRDTIKKMKDEGELEDLRKTIKEMKERGDLDDDDLEEK